MTDDETMIGTAGGPPGVPTTTKELLEIIDTLWGELPLDAVRRVTRERPDIADACKAVHELVWHA